MATAAATLALANATAYSGVVIDPVVITFAFLLWLPLMRLRQAVYCTTLLIGGSGRSLLPPDGYLAVLERDLFQGLNRHIADYQDLVLHRRGDTSKPWAY